MNKRTFIKHFTLGCMSSTLFLEQISALAQSVAHLSPQDVAQDEDFWLKIRSGYRLKPDYINLEGGYYCMMPQEILENYLQHIRDVNYQHSYYMRTVQFNNKRRMQERLAEMAGCSADELIITRNTTESLDTIIGGFPWKAGDEAVMAAQDYGAMLDMFALQARRHGVVNKIISLPNHPASDEEIVDLYAQAITPKTRLLMVCHLVNITGQILPVRKITDMAHSRGVEVMVDGAHAFAHIRFSIEALGCDYYGASLHKWLSVPLGAGILYVKKVKIPQIWPMFAEEGLQEDDLRRLNHTGTHPVATDLAIQDALDYYYLLGAERKEARLHYLQQYWTSQVRELPHIILNTPADPQRHGAIGNVGIQGIEPGTLAKMLLEKYQIWTVAIDRPGVKGVRITPNIYTTTKELDVLVKALKELKN